MPRNSVTLLVLLPTKDRFPCQADPFSAVLPPPYPSLVLKAILYGVGTQTWKCGWVSFGSPQPGVGAANVWDVGRLVFEDPAFYRSLSTDSLLRRTMAPTVSAYLNPVHQLGMLISRGDSFKFYRWYNDSTREAYFTGKVYAHAKPPKNALRDFAVEDRMGRRRSDDSRGALDWLKLRGVGDGQSMEVYRVSTVGGVWNDGMCVGLPAEKRIPYTTLLWFYGPPERAGITLSKEPKKFCESL